MENIRKLLDTKEYDFLRTNPHLGDNICLLTVGGSHAYGTNIEGSDVDLRGITLETPDVLLTNNSFEQYVSQATDTTIYGLKKIFSLLANCNPNTIEMLGTRDYFILTDAGKELLKNKELFLSKKAAHAFGGYASAQLRRLDNKSARVLSQEDQEKHILNSIINAKNSIISHYTDLDVEFDIKDSDKDELDKEIVVSLNIKDYPLRDFNGLISEFKEIVKVYDKNSHRNSNAIAHNKLAKHMMHLIRLYGMAIDILKYGEINTYRTKEHDLLMSIRNGDYLDELQQPTKEFMLMVKDYESQLNEAVKTSELPDVPDYKALDKLMMSIYNTYVFNRG